MARLGGLGERRACLHRPFECLRGGRVRRCSSSGVAAAPSDEPGRVPAPKDLKSRYVREREHVSSVSPCGARGARTQKNSLRQLARGAHLSATLGETAGKRRRKSSKLGTGYVRSPTVGVRLAALPGMRGERGRDPSRRTLATSARANLARVTCTFTRTAGQSLSALRASVRPVPRSACREGPPERLWYHLKLLCPYSKESL